MDRFDTANKSDTELGDEHYTGTHETQGGLAKDRFYVKLEDGGVKPEVHESEDGHAIDAVDSELGKANDVGGHENMGGFDVGRCTEHAKGY